MYKKWKIVSIFSILLTFLVTLTVHANDEEVINEKLGVPIVVYGESLSEAQKQEVKRLLNVDETSNVKEITVTAKDLVKYINGDPNSQMFSSAKITRLNEGEGLKVNQVTPENITEVTDEMYANALLTAGIKDAQIDVASPIKVTGHSALTGIYKAYEESGGEELDRVRLEISNDELNLATDLAKKEGLNQEAVSQLFTGIKQEMADQVPSNREDIEKIVDEQLKSLNIQLSEADRQKLIDLFDRMRSININFEEVKNQLNDIAKQLKDKINDVIQNEGFWNKLIDGIVSFFQAIINFFQAIINFFKELF